MLKVVTFAGGIVFIAVSAMVLNTAATSGKAEAANCETITIQPDAAYGITRPQKLRICR
ncbi:MAG: hypothetical protein KDJ29_02615 [Hyphomicrobiales bacterium]|nr:hypothetical protein [Hyphomicrobiales bacterium]